MTGEVPDYSVLNFSLSNPTGEGQGDVARLLRSLATSIESLGDVQIHDITFGSRVTSGEDDLHFTVYYDDRPRRI